jgi:hypothetical protein
MPLFPGSRYVPFILGTVIFFYGGLVFLLGAGDKLKNHRPGQPATTCWPSPWPQEFWFPSVLVMPMAVGTIVMSASTIIVAFNDQLRNGFLFKPL